MEIVGRESEIDSVTRFLDAIPDGPRALVLEGEAGIGKTTVWEYARASALEREYRVLSCRPAESETKLSFSGLADLLVDVLDEAMRTVPPPQARALNVALLQTDPENAPPHQRTIAAGFLSTVEALSASRPVVLAVDDVQWLDTPSARALEYAARRLGNRPVGIVVTLRRRGTTSTPLGLDRALTAERLHSMHVRPLTLAALHVIIKQRLGRVFPRPILVRIHGAARGNPFFALEIARALALRDEPLRPGEALPVPLNLKELVFDRIGALAPNTRQALLVAAALAEPTLDTITNASVRDMDGALAQAQAAGILELDGGRVRFAHPLLASIVYSAAPERDRRELHRKLARVVHDIEERARHLALGADGPDEDVAARLEEAANQAQRRGAVTGASELMELACSLTPPDRERQLLDRRAALGSRLFESGDSVRAREVLEGVARDAEPSAAWLKAVQVLIVLLSETEGPQAGTSFCERALAETALDRKLRARLHTFMAFGENAAASARHARAALELIQQEREPDPDALSVAQLAWSNASFLLGEGFDVGAVSRALELRRTSAAPPHSFAAWYAWMHKYCDDFGTARDGLAREYTRALDTAEEPFISTIVGHMAELELWAGEWARAERHVAEQLELAERTGQRTETCCALYVKSFLEAYYGRSEAAQAAGREALQLAERIGDLWGQGRSLWALGFIELSRGEPAAAVEHLERVDEIAESIELREPGVWRFHGDHIEAHVALGELDRAEALLERLEERGREAKRLSALAVATRSRGLLFAARGDAKGALSALEHGLEQHQALPSPFELARTLLAKGQVERRAKRKREATRSLNRALAIFDELGAPNWASRARAELARVGLRPRSPDDLTESERRVAELAAAGMTNKDVAARLFMSPKTVEANLARVYRKLRIHSRAELGSRVRPPDPI